MLGGTGLRAGGLRAHASRAAAAGCKGRKGDEGALAAAASPFMRPGEMNKTLALHAGDFWCRQSALMELQQHYCVRLGVNYSLCNFYLT